MRIAELFEPRKFRIVDGEVSDPGPGEIQVRVQAVGICGSDTHYFAGRRDHEPQTIYPFVLGHEFAGDVAAVGEGVTGVDIGARVCCAPDQPCGRCEWCRKGEINVCPDVRFAGSGGIVGCLSEYYLVKSSQLHPIPDSLGYAQATLAEPLAIGLHIVDNLIGPHGNRIAAVVGAGPIGLCTCFALKLRKVPTVYVSDRLAPRLQAARRLGADGTCLVSAESFLDFIREKTAGRGVDIAVEAAGELAAIPEAVGLAAIHGTVVIEGIPEGSITELNIDFCRRRELKIVFGRRSVHKTDEALRLIAQGTFDTGVLITHEFALHEAQKAFEIARDYSEGAIKVILKP